MMANTKYTPRPMVGNFLRRIVRREPLPDRRPPNPEQQQKTLPDVRSLLLLLRDTHAPAVDSRHRLRTLRSSPVPGVRAVHLPVTSMATLAEPQGGRGVSDTEFMDKLTELFPDNVRPYTTQGRWVFVLDWSNADFDDPDFEDLRSPLMYADNGDIVAEKPRPCAHCNLTSPNPSRSADPCLGWLDGVRAACCDHGNDSWKIYNWGGPYIAFEDGVDIEKYRTVCAIPDKGLAILRRQDALDWFADHGVGPDVVQQKSVSSRFRGSNNSPAQPGRTP